MSAASTRLHCINTYIFSRIGNALRAYVSYALSLCGSVHIAHAPLFVSVEPANICQLRCPECPVGLSKGERIKVKGERIMSQEVWQRTLEEAKQTAWVMQFYFQGEPLLNPNLSTMIREAHEAGLYTLLSTNAQALSPKLAEALIRAGLNRIIVSMDGLTEESYGAYRMGGSMEKTKAALRYLREAKDRLHGRTVIELQCLRLRTNEQEWPAFRHQHRSLGADRMVFKTAQLYDYANGHPLMPSNPRYSRYILGSDGHYHLRRRPKTCWRVWSGCVITTAGDVLPCCYDKAHTHAYGNIMSASMRELFTSETAKVFRCAALNQLPEICKECWK